MATSGLFKKCACRDTVTRRRLGVRCTQLGQRGHGSWYFRCYVRDLYGRAVQVRRGGFGSQAAAHAARAATLAESAQQFAGRTWTVRRWLQYWLSTRRSIRPTTSRPPGRSSAAPGASLITTCDDTVRVPLH